RANSKERLYVVDAMKHRVVMVSATGAIVGSFGTRGSEPGEFNFPTNIARSPDGRLFVTDSMNFRVQVFSEDGRLLSTFGRLGDGSGDFDKPKGIAVDSAGHIYVVEGSTTWCRSSTTRASCCWRSADRASARDSSGCRPASPSRTTSCTSPTRRTVASRCSST